MNARSVLKQYFTTDPWFIFGRYFKEQYRIYMYFVVVLKLPESVIYALRRLFLTDTILCRSVLRLARKKERKVPKSSRCIPYADGHFQIEDFQIGSIAQINGRLVDFRVKTGTIYTWDDRFPKKSYSYPHFNTVVLTRTEFIVEVFDALR